MARLALRFGLGAAVVMPVMSVYSFAAVFGSGGGGGASVVPMAARRQGGVDYSLLGGRGFGSIKSFGREAAEFALQGKVPEVSHDGYEVATFAGGCFWGTELHFQRQDGVIATCVGYTQGTMDAPTYGEVCSGRSGHTEAVQLLFDPKRTSYRSLCDTLLSTIDPTVLNRVGADVGTQYRHGIYFHSRKQQKVAEAAVSDAQRRAGKRTVVTELCAASLFWPAETQHQQYLQKGGRFGSAQKVDKGCTDPVRCYG